jgi:hypothetical protein
VPKTPPGLGAFSVILKVPVGLGVDGLPNDPKPSKSDMYSDLE